MFGINGVIAESGETVRSFTSAFARNEPEQHQTFIGESLGIDLIAESLVEVQQPVSDNEDTGLIWLLGNIYGYLDSDGYVPLSPMDNCVETCATLYERYGLNFVPRLNGDFVGVVFDRQNETVSIFLDRLGSQPVFYAQPEDKFLFSTQIQSLLAHPDVSVEFDHDFLFEYIVFRRVFGVHTPFVGVKNLPPASITTVNISTNELTSTVYWEPIYQPIEAPVEYFVERLKSTFTTVLEEWTDPDLRYGLMLSGGSDSRLILATMPVPVTSFHMCDWSSREMQTAKQSAETVGGQFTLLEREETYYKDLFRLNGGLSNFDGYFFQGYTIPFTEQIRNTVDVMLSGLYADVLFKGHSHPTKSVSLGRFGTLSLPYIKKINSISTLIDHMIESGGNSLPNPPEYLETDSDMESILRRNITKQGSKIDHHGVLYNSFDDLLLSHEFYPLSNDTETIFTNALRQTIPYRTPFLDNRLIDLHLKIPPRYTARKNIIYRTLSDIDPELANIPHVATGFPLTYPPIAHYLGRNIYGVLDKHGLGNRPPKPYFAHTSWRNHAEFIRQNDFIIDTIMENRTLMDRLSFINKYGAFATYTDHLDSADFTTELFTLVTILGTPTVREYYQEHFEQSPALGLNRGEV